MSHRIHQSMRLCVHLAFTFMLILLIASAAGAIILHARGERLLSVQSASMVPAFRPGDAILVQPASLSSLRPGQIVSYKSPLDTRVTISHRLIRFDQRTGKLTTAGDVSHRPDPPVSSQQLVGRAVAVAPRLGTVLDMLRRPLGLMGFVYLPAALILIFEASRFNYHYRRPVYLLDCRYGTKG